MLLLALSLALAEPGMGTADRTPYTVLVEGAIGMDRSLRGGGPGSTDVEVGVAVQHTVGRRFSIGVENPWVLELMEAPLQPGLRAVGEWHPQKNGFHGWYLQGGVGARLGWSPRAHRVGVLPSLRAAAGWRGVWHPGSSYGVQLFADVQGIGARITVAGLQGPGPAPRPGFRGKGLKPEHVGPAAAVALGVSAAVVAVAAAAVFDGW